MVVNETSAPGFSQVPDHFPKCANFDFLSPEPATPPQEPSTPTALSIISPEELDTYKRAAIALAVLLFVLLTLLIAAVVVALVLCIRKGGSKTAKEELEMK